MLKVENNTTPENLRRIFQEIWDNEQAPDEWSTGAIIKLPKKGDLGNCNSRRGITLLPLTSKVFTRIILNTARSVMNKLPFGKDRPASTTSLC